MSEVAANARASLIVIDGFLPEELATGMRADIEAHFAEPYRQSEAQQVWNYWFVPQLYTYLRTAPQKVIHGDRVARFHAALQAWSIATMGMGRVSWPFLSLYVDGCVQGLHNDARSGRFGFVYSLTRDNRQTVGGDALVMRETDHFRSNLRTAAAAQSFYDLIEPRFNRLLIFDNRLLHAVTRVEGPMDPLEGRFVLQGHLSEAGTVVDGALPLSAAVRPISLMLDHFVVDAAARIALHHGVMTVRLRVDRGGKVSECGVLSDRVLHPDPGDVDWHCLREDLVCRFQALRFPSAAGETVVIQPVVFGDAIPA